MGGPYLGDRVVWTFADEGERERYLATQSKRESHVISFVVLLALTVGTLVPVLRGDGRGVVLIPVLAFLALAWQTARWLVERWFPITSVELQLRPKFVSITEHFGVPNWFRSKNVLLVGQKIIVKAYWATHGLHLKTKALGRQPVVSDGFFRDARSLEALYRWAESVGLEIEGVPPLPGGYVRPIGGPERG